MDDEKRLAIYLAAWFIISVLVLSLFGCKSTPPSETIADNAKETISQAYNNLPKECKSESTKKAMESAQAQIDAVVASCETEKREIEMKAQSRLLKSWLIGLVVAIIALIGLRVRGWLHL